MQFQRKTKELLGSFRTIMSTELLEEIESYRLYGDATRSDSRECFCPGSDTSQDEHWLTLSVYRPNELREGVPCLVRTLRKSRRGSWLYKIVLIPHAILLEKEPFQFEEPEDFWEEAYQQYLPQSQASSQDEHHSPSA